jgi:hypothetical protein
MTITPAVIAVDILDFAISALSPAIHNCFIRKPVSFAKIGPATKLP